MNMAKRQRIPNLPTGSRPIVPPVKQTIGNVVYGAFTWHEPITPDPLSCAGLMAVIIFVDFQNRKKIGHVS